MDAAKAAINKVTGHRGHTTDVDEVVNPAITSETVKPHRHEEITKAVDREVHQDHYHTTVQPISHREQLPERHTHNQLPTEQREFQHGDHEHTRSQVAAEIGRFRDTTTTAQTQHTQSAAPTVTGEHVHHHVHETVQPVIHKEVIQPEVVHTTQAIHEVHQAPAEKHGISVLPEKTLNDFKSAGGLLSGTQSSHTHERYDGAPRPYNEKFSTTIEKVLPGNHGHSHTTGTSTHRPQDSGIGLGSGTSSGIGSGHTSNTSGTGSSRPTAGDKLNPRVDADRDGKAGVLD